MEDKEVLHCPAHEQIKIDSVIMMNHVKEGGAWRIAIVGVAAGLLIQIIVLASMWGRLCAIVDLDSSRISKLEDLFPRTRGMQGATGEQGIAGAQGIQGIQGVQGLQGVAGATGK